MLLDVVVYVYVYVVVVLMVVIIVSKFVMEHSLKESREQLSYSNRTLDLSDKVCKPLLVNTL